MLIRISLQYTTAWRGRTLVALLQTMATEEDGMPVLYVLEMQVAESERGRGLGHELMERAREEAAALGLPLMLTVLESNEGALRFYEREGFAVDPALSVEGEFYIMSSDGFIRAST